MTAPADPAADWPALSVVVPVRDDARNIGVCVRALLTQDYPGPRPEILVVDNGSRDGTLDVLRDFAEAIVLVQEPLRGASRARNAGIARAKHGLIAFTDADCVPHPGWLRALVATRRRDSEAAFVGGRICSLEPTNSIGRFADTLFDQRRAILEYRPPYVITANLLARRADLERFGLFDPAYLRGQDAELAWRAYYRYGARFAYAEDAVVDHVQVRTLVGLWRKGLQHGQGAARIWRDYQADLGRSPRDRLRLVKPYRDAVRETVALVPLLWRDRGEGPARLDPFYSSLFQLARHLSFCRHTLFPRDPGP